MALCPTAANPAATITDGLQLWQSYGNTGDDPNMDFRGDYIVAGVGTRNFGNGIIKVRNLPNNIQFLQSWLIYNTYVSNNQPDPIVTINGNPVAATLYGICGSTCWFNPGAEATTYLRNRVYVADVTADVTSNGDYVIAGLPVNLGMPIGADGDRLPGCTSSQGAILFIVYQYADGATDPRGKTYPPRGIQAYLGAKLLASNTGLWGGSTSYKLQFEPLKKLTNNKFYKGNTNVVIAAGDTQAVISGDRFAVNQVNFAPLNNAFIKIGSSLSVRKFSIAQIYDGQNSATASTNNDCICWFFFVISGDLTEPKAQFQVVSCACTFLQHSVDKPDLPEIPADEIIVGSNYVLPFQSGAQVQEQEASSIGRRCSGQRWIPGNDGDNVPGKFPNPPFYVSIQNKTSIGGLTKGSEIMKVVAKSGGPGLAIQENFPFGFADNNPPAQDQTTWKVERGTNGSIIDEHTVGTCVFLLSPPGLLRDMNAGLAARGRPAQRPNPGRPMGRRR